MIIELVSYKPDSYENVFYKRDIISKNYIRQFKSVITRGYKMWQNGITKCVSLVDYKCSNIGLQSVLGVGLQSVAK